MKMLKRKVWKGKLAAWLIAMVLLTGLCPQTLHAAETGRGENSKGFTWTEDVNMAITEDPAVAGGLPTGLNEDVYTKWATCIGLWQGLDKGEVSNPVFLNGSIYIFGEKQIKKVDPKTGTIEKTAKLANSTGYNYFLQTAGDKLVIQEGLMLEAFDADLNSLWVTESMESGSQGLCPLNYADGVVYGGTVAPGGRSGCYFAVSMADGKILWKQETELVYCGSSKRYTGYYWAGAAIIGNYLVYGSEGGRVYSTNRHTGEIVDRYDISPEDYSRSIRSSVAYDGSCVYFTDTNASLYQVEYDAKSGRFGNGKSQLVGEKAGSDGFGSTCTATPVIYKNRLYVGDATCLAVFDTNDLSLIYRVKHSFSTLRDLRLVADTANNCVYVFTSYYKNPGSVVMMKDAPGQTDGELVDFSSLTTQWKQFNASMPIWGPDGTIYLTNDLGYLIAIGKANAWLKDMRGNGSFDNELNNGISDYEMVVAPGTEKAKLVLTVNEGSSLRVNGEEISLVDQTGTAVISLKDTDAAGKQSSGRVTANIEVVKGDDIRSYRIAVREASQNADIAAAVVNQSNNITGSVKEVKKLEDNVYICYGQNSTFMRLWIRLADEGASHAVYALNTLGGSSKVDGETGLVGNTSTGTGSGSGYLRWNLYWSEPQIVVKVQTTAEDGITTTEQYYIMTQAKEADFTGSQAETDILALIHENADTDTFIRELKAHYNQKNPAVNYREAQQTELLEKLNTGITAIRAAASKEEQEAALAAARSALDEVKTDEELTREEQKQNQDPPSGGQNQDKDKDQDQHRPSREPGTGDTAGNRMILYAVLAVVSLSMLVLLLRRKRQR